MCYGRGFCSHVDLTVGRHGWVGRTGGLGHRTEPTVGAGAVQLAIGAVEFFVCRWVGWTIVSLFYLLSPVGYTPFPMRRVVLSTIFLCLGTFPAAPFDP